MSQSTADLPAGVQLRRLTVHRDERGSVAEIFRAEWSCASPVQWNMTTSNPGVLRGVHVHPRHDDYLIVPQGRMSLGLRDLRPDSPSEGRATLIELRSDDLTAVVIPHGVAHGLYFHEPSIFMIGVSVYWDPADELGCQWNDPALEIPWPVTSVRLSARDQALPSLHEVVRSISPWQPR